MTGKPKPVVAHYIIVVMRTDADAARGLAHDIRDDLAVAIPAAFQGVHLCTDSDLAVTVSELMNPGA
jgi:hypothetical protein